MANPFFSGRIPPGLAIQIDAHLLVTGETRSELLVRLLRSEIGDNKPDNNVDNKADDVITNLLSRIERLEQLIDNKIDNVPDPKPDSIEAPEVATEILPTTLEALAKRLQVSKTRLRESAATDESWRDLMAARPDPQSLQWERPIKVDRTWRIACLASL